jgi:asparagine synthase (glutamine-hydrolysing)
MCGITGWVSFDRELRTEAATLDAMTETMACRGPDDRGVWAQGPAALGHRRLAILLDRKDRASMAVGLEVRVPFCDHRLVEYVYNTPWSLKSYDGREKTLLREATADVLPKSVYDRVKSPYPSTQDPKYAVALQDHAKDLLARPSHPVFDLVDRDRLRRVAHSDAPISTQAGRRGLERALDLALWLDLYRPEISLA